MNKLNAVIQNAMLDKNLPFSMRTSKGEMILKADQKRINAGVKEISYISGDGTLRVFLTLTADEESEMLSASIRLYALKTLPYTLNQIKIADMIIPAENGETKLWASSGGFTLWAKEAKYPPLMLRDAVYDIAKDGKKIISSNLSGRSSDENLPIWIAQIDAGGGVWFGPEWSGSWEMSIERKNESVSLSLLLPTMDFMLAQGEEIELPSFLIGEYAGDLFAGSNALRRAVREKLTPKIDGKSVTPPVVFQGLDGMEMYQNEEYLVRESKLASEIGIENFVFDAGWNHDLYQLDISVGREGYTRVNPWFTHLGHWIPSKERFPSGMDRFGQHVKNHGMRFGIWTEPRVTEGREDYNEYSDVLLKPNDNAVGEFDKKNLLADLGQKRGEDYYVGVIEKFVEEYGANWLWFDFNTNPRTKFWDTIEEPNRKGIRELKFYKGLYNFFDRIHKEYPHLWIESCASGGRLIDLGVLRRSHSIWVSDFSAYECIGNPTDMDICRNMRSGLNKFIPAAYIQNAFFIPKADRESEKPYALYNYLCHFAGALQYGQGILDWKDADKEMATYITSVYKTYRHYLEKDYYQLVPIPDNKKGWDGWQFDDRDTDSGIFILFRMEDCEDETFVIPTHGIGEYDRYRFDVILGNGTVQAVGNELAANLSEKRDAMLVHYSNTDRPSLGYA